MLRRRRLNSGASTGLAPIQKGARELDEHPHAWHVKVTCSPAVLST
jgi:hypothetical protein